MKSLVAPLSALALIGCSAQSPQATVEVSGNPVEVAAFIKTEKINDENVDVAYQQGGGKAVFATRTSDQTFQISRRAIRAGLSIDAKATS